jgi:anti-sigma factor RsiW
MTPTNTSVSDAELQAWVDGQLPADRVAAVSAWLQAHPDDARRVHAWQGQRQALQALHRDLLDEPVPLALARATRPRRALSWPHGMAAALLLAIGFGSGWWVRPDTASTASDRTKQPTFALDVPSFVREARGAHAVYVPEQRHPVEVGAGEQAHLVQWLSKRLGRSLKAPILDREGFALIGGRLVSNEGGQPRALLMYERSGGARVTLHVSALEGALASELANFQFASAGSMQTFYWVQGSAGYALSGNVDRATLARLADATYAQLNLP